VQFADSDLRVGVATVPPGHRRHTGRKFKQIERFDQVVVGPGIEAGDAIGYLVLGSQDDHRSHISGAALLAQEVQSATVRQHQVEQDQIVRRRAYAVARMSQALHPIDRVAVIGDLFAHRLPQPWRVLNQ